MAAEFWCPGRSAACSTCGTLRCRAGAVPSSSVRDGPGSAERHEECRTASGTPCSSECCDARASFVCQMLAASEYFSDQKSGSDVMSRLALSTAVAATVLFGAAGGASAQGYEVSLLVPG